jgi:hypothetical protein
MSEARPGDDGPRADIVEEARALVRLAELQLLKLRLIGGVAIGVRSKGPHPAIGRVYKDIDLVASKGTSSKVSKLFTRRGYAQDEQFNAMHGHFRLIYQDIEHGRQVDVFVGKFEMCHSLPLGDRLHLDAVTLPPADLLLTKLQIIELTDKDQRDLFCLLLDHEISDVDGDDLNGTYVAQLCAEDWGLWRTCTRNLDRLAKVLEQYALSADERAVVIGRLGELQRRISVRPKSLRWKARAVVGEKLPWYDLPEEVAD